MEADDPDTPDVVETKQETWYIYTLVYNYFADQVFHLTDDQKGLAGDYAQNLSLFLGDGSIQHTEYTGGTITSLGDVRFTDGATEVVYFNQLDQRYANQPFGTGNIGGYGCGPTSMAIVVSSLTDEIVDPIAMARWAYENGGWCKGQGSYHSLIPNAAKAWGLNVAGCKASEPQRILDALSQGNLVVAIMGKGHFTTTGHFIVLRGVQDGKILVADPASTSRSQKAWDLSIILNEAGHRAGAGRSGLSALGNTNGRPVMGRPFNRASVICVHEFQYSSTFSSAACGSSSNCFTNSWAMAVLSAANFFRVSTMA